MQPNAAAPPSEATESSQRSTVFVADGAALRAGDIVLSTQSTSLVSKLIRGVTASDFSHAAIVMYDAVCVEAVGSGVRVINLRRVHVEDLSKVRVLRLRTSDGLAIASQAAKLAKVYLFRPYWKSGAVAAPLKNSGKRQNTESFFCSHLVSRCYLEAGLELVSDRTPEGTVPGHLFDSEYLEDITQAVFAERDRNHAPRRSLDNEGYPEGADTAFADLNHAISSEMKKELKSDSYLSRFVNEVSGFVDFLAIYLKLGSSAESSAHLHRYDEALCGVFERTRFNEFLTIDLPAKIPMSYLPVDFWEDVADAVGLSSHAMAEEKRNQLDILGALRGSKKIFGDEWSSVDEAFRVVPSLGDYHGARMIHRFFRERVEVTERQIHLVEQKIALWERLAGWM